MFWIRRLRFNIAVRERHYPKESLVLRVSRLRFVLSFSPTVCSLSARVYSPPTLTLPNLPTSPNESLQITCRLSIASYKLLSYTTPSRGEECKSRNQMEEYNFTSLLSSSASREKVCPDGKRLKIVHGCWMDVGDFELFDTISAKFSGV